MRIDRCLAGNALGLITSLMMLLPVSTNAEPIIGSGSTFAYPMIASWSEGFQILRADGTDFVSNDGGVSYEPIGSVGGMMRMQQAEVDFAATDAPLQPADLASRGLAQFPIIVGGVAVVVNVAGVESGQIRLPRATLADIYLGRVINWSDPALSAANPELELPDLPISVVGRLDGSGSTRSFTQYLSLSSAEWQSKFGTSTKIAWPTGISVKGTSKIIDAVSSTEGAISYVEFGQARRAGLTIAVIENLDGTFILPSEDAFSKTASAANWQDSVDFYVQLAEVRAAGAYPITTATFALMRKSDSSARTRRTLYFFDFALEKGANRARALGYVPLPDDLVAKVQDYWRKTLPGAQAF
jgi:phosphate transport system substrate-binding protein